MSKEELTPLLVRITEALERLAPPSADSVKLSEAKAYLWQAKQVKLTPVTKVNRTDLDLLKGINSARDVLVANTLQFANGMPANNVLLWGARGMGKSSLVKAVHAKVSEETTSMLTLIEINREDLASLPELLKLLKNVNRRCILFCDDLSFSDQDLTFKSLKTVLEGGIEGRPSNVVFYATSNRRHLIPRQMIENEASTAIKPSESVDEKVSLSDRFGIWLGFYNCSQDDFFKMVEGYVDYYKIPIEQNDLRTAAIAWSMTRGARSGRVAWQFIQDLAGRLKVPISY